MTHADESFSAELLARGVGLGEAERVVTEAPRLQIETLGLQQLDACVALVSASSLLLAYHYGAEAARRDLSQAMLGADSEVRVALAAPHALGFYWVVRNGAFARSPYLKLLLVAESASGAGVGRQLMADLEQRHLGDKGLFLLCNSENAGAAGFYSALGYTQIGRIPDYTRAGADELIFFKPSPRRAPKAER